MLSPRYTIINVSPDEARSGHYLALRKVSESVDPHAPETLYAGTSTPGLVKTTTGGRSWRSIDPPGKGDVVALALDPTDPSTIYAGMRDGAHAFKSTDGGRTWSALAIPVP